MDDLPEVLMRMNARLETLESRVSLLEHPSESVPLLTASVPLLAAAPQPLEIGPSQAIEASSFAQAGATFPVFGKAMLGLAGAYVLRAVAESGSLPKLAVVALAIAYAGMWLVFAVRVPAKAWVASTVYAGTSALILAPMLWELTLSFKVLTPAAAALVLGAFVVAAYAIAWKRDLISVVWVADSTAAIASMALLIATHRMAPFLTVLLLMALLSEAAAGRNRWISVRPLVAAAADLAIWSLIFIYASPESSRADYPQLNPPALLAPAAALFLIYAASIASRTILQRRRISLFETMQAIIAFLLAADAILHFARASGATVFGLFCLLLSPACYTAAFALFDKMPKRRNYHVYATWGAALFLLGCFLCLTPMWFASLLGAAAIIATVLGVRRARLALEFHGLIFLLAAAFASGLLDYAARALAGTFPAPPMGIAWIISAATLLCYAAGGQFEGPSWNQRLIRVLSATIAVGAVATILVSALVWLTATVITPGAPHVAVIRTLTTCMLALGLAFAGPRWQRIELVWIAYAMLVLIAAKLLLEDLRQGHPEFIAASIFLYAVTLILVPRLSRKPSKKSATT